jgi:hypothetical protein
MHAVNNSMNHLCAVLNKYFDASGHLKSQQDIDAWKMPISLNTAVPAARQKSGFYRYDLFPTRSLPV